MTDLLILDGGQKERDAHISPAPVDLLATDQTRSGAHTRLVGGDLLDGGQRPSDTQSTHAPVDLLATDHIGRDTHAALVGGDPLDGGQSTDALHRLGAPVDPSAGGHDPTDTQAPRAPGTLSSQPTTIEGPTFKVAPSSGWLELRIWAEMFHDAQLQRIASVNRAERGGVDPGHYASHIEAVERTEKVTKRGLLLCYRRVVPIELQRWQQNAKGIGDHQLARLLGQIGDPLVADPHHWEGTGDKRVLIADEPYVRTVSQLWAYCGHGDPARRKTKGMTADDALALGKPFAKSLLFQMAEACMKARGEYKTFYDQRRLVTADRVHAAPCVRCGPSGKPAPEGSPWSKGHQHADALRVLGKEILRHMWLTRRLAVTA